MCPDLLHEGGSRLFCDFEHRIAIRDEVSQGFADASVERCSVPDALGVVFDFSQKGVDRHSGQRLCFLSALLLRFQCLFRFFDNRFVFRDRFTFFIFQVNPESGNFISHGDGGREKSFDFIEFLFRRRVF